MHPDPSTEKLNWGAWLDLWLRASHLLLGGVVMAIYAGDELLRERFPDLANSWRGPVVLANTFACLWLLWALSRKSTELKHPNTAFVTALFILGYVVTAWQREHLWAVIAISAVGAIGFVQLAKLYQRPFVIAIAGWILAGISVMYLLWPNAQRYLLVIVLGSLGNALQGAFDLPQKLRTLEEPGGETAAKRN